MSVSDVTRPESHAISDSDPELPVVVRKKKRAPRKTVEPPVVAAIVIAPTLKASATVPVIPTQDSRELAEIGSMFQEIKGLTERNVAYVELLAKIEQTKQDAVNVVALATEPEQGSGVTMLHNTMLPVMEGNECTVYTRGHRQGTLGSVSNSK